MTVGEKMKQVRKIRELSLTDLAKKSGISRGYLHGMESNFLCNPTLAICSKIAVALEMNLSAFLADIDDFGDNHDKASEIILPFDEVKP